jgi:hypothetical protein
VEMKSVSVHEEVPKEDAAVETGRALNKRHRDRNLAIGRSGEPKKRTQGNGGCRKILAATRKGMTYWEEWHGAGTRQGQCCTRNPEKADVREEASGASRMQQRDKERKPKTTVTSGKQEDIRRVLHEGSCTGSREANSQIFRQDAENERQGIVEGSAPPKRKN